MPFVRGGVAEAKDLQAKACQPLGLLLFDESGTTLAAAAGDIQCDTQGGQGLGT